MSSRNDNLRERIQKALVQADQDIAGLMDQQDWLERVFNLLESTPELFPDTYSDDPDNVENILQSSAEARVLALNRAKSFERKALGMLMESRGRPGLRAESTKLTADTKRMLACVWSVDKGMERLQDVVRKWRQDGGSAGTGSTTM